MSIRIAVLDDEPFNLNMYRRLLTSSGYHVDAFADGQEFLDALTDNPPDLALLDIRMPGMDGYEVCRALRANDAFADTPVMFVTALDTKESRSLAFAAGANEFLAKPVREDALLVKIEQCFRNSVKLAHDTALTTPTPKEFVEKTFPHFKKWLTGAFTLHEKDLERLSKSSIQNIYRTATSLGIPEHQLALAMAEFAEEPYLPYLDPQQVEYGDLSPAFCKANRVVPMNLPDYGKVLVVCNPFDMSLINLLEQCVSDFRNRSLCVTKPDSMHILFIGEQQGLDATPIVSLGEKEQVSNESRRAESLDDASIEQYPIPAASQAIIEAAILEKASDIHIEPQGHSTLVRFRIDGDLHGRFLLHDASGKMLITRFKVLSNMDIAEQRRPQDGSFTFLHENHEYRLRTATSLTSHGEGLTMRLLSLGGSMPSPVELGMTARQGDDLISIGGQRIGLVLIVGPCGSGKTTTAYSLLQSMDRKKRNMISVEDPIEYRMQYVTQQQINDKIGVSFESLLKTSVRQDPDVLFLGEIRDNYSARVAVDFSSTGKLTIGTLHTTDAASAIFRLQRLGISREDIADSLLCITAQQLVRKLCPHCREEGEISREERSWLEGQSTPIPERVARPAGCAQCKYKGYLGREAIFEIMRFTPEMLMMIREGAPIPEIRRVAVSSGSWLFAQHAIQKVGSFTISPADAYLQFLQRSARQFAPHQATEDCQ